MIDRNKLNRIKGVLSARLGAEIPKFSGGAKFTRHKGTQTIYSNDNVSWYLDLDLTAPFEGDINEFKDVNPQLQLEIPGDPKLTPYSGVEQALKTSTETSRAVILLQAAEAAVKAMKDTPFIKINNPNPEEEGLNNNEEESNNNSNGGNTEDSSGRNEEGSEEGGDEEDKENWFKKAGKAVGEFGLNAGMQAFLGIEAYMGAQQAATDSTTTKTADMIYDLAAGIIEKMGPVGKAIGTAMGFAGTAGDIIQGLGGGTDQMTTTDKWMDSSFFSWNIGMINGFGGKKTDAFAADLDILSSVGSSYGGTTEDINNAAAKASKKYGLFSSGSRRKANRLIADARNKLNLMGDISEEATDLRLAAQSMGELAGLAYALMTDGGYSLKYTYAAKLGGLLEWNPVIELEWQPQIELNWELPALKEGGIIEESLEWVLEFKEGGKTKELDIPEIEETSLKNVIPEGALHKNKHHMEHAEGLTKKGIPVIDEDGEQLAEIEHSEIIFTLEVTKKLEEYYDTFYSEDSTNKEKEQAALDAGKLLVYLILENTEDRTGLIESCKKGGTLSLKKSTDDLIEEVLEWMPTIVVVEEFKEKPKKKSEKELMKEAIKEVLIELLTK